MFMSRSGSRLVLALAVVGSLPAASRAERSPPSAVVSRPLPSDHGARAEAEATIEAPAEQLAALISEPNNFVPLFPAERIEVLKSAPSRQLVSVEMRKPWPVGTVRWVEEVVTYRENDGRAFVVERTAQAGGFFKQMRAVWRIAPHPDSELRSVVTYQVLTEPARWAPEWMLKRGNLSGVVDTMGRLKKLVAERLPPEARGSAEPDR